VPNKKVIAVSIAVILLAFAVITLAEVDFVRWFTCTGPFSPSVDQASGVCRRLEDTP